MRFAVFFTVLTYFYHSFRPKKSINWISTEYTHTSKMGCYFCCWLRESYIRLLLFYCQNKAAFVIALKDISFYKWNTVKTMPQNWFTWILCYHWSIDIDWALTGGRSSSSSNSTSTNSELCGTLMRWLTCTQWLNNAYTRTRTRNTIQ